MSKRLELAVESPPQNEATTIQEVEEITLKLLKEDYPAHVRPAKRDAHAKHHGCVKAEFIVESDLPDDLKVGVFKQPRTYPAWVRFSNGARYPQDDRKGDSRGMAVKLMGVEGDKVLEAERHEQTQDFTLANHPVFAFRNAQDYLEFFRLRLKGEKQLIKFYFNGVNPLKWRWHEFRIARSVERKKVVSPLTTQYWSMAPYRLGEHAVKFSFKPQSTESPVQPDLQSKHYLHEVMVQHLKSQPAYFDFLIQIQTDSEKMPIEDPTIAWDEAVSPYRKLATLKIPPQSFDSPEQMQFCEDLTFTPWHTLPEHQPIGGINRMRRRVYEVAGKLRHTLNSAPQREPTPDDVFQP